MDLRIGLAGGRRNSTAGRRVLNSGKLKAGWVSAQHSSEPGPWKPGKPSRPEEQPCYDETS